MTRILQTDLGVEPSALEALGPGTWSRGFAFEANGKPSVIRFSRHPEDFDRDAFAERYRSPDLPIPTVTHRGTYGALHYAVSERVPGGFIDDLSSNEFRRLMPSLLRTFDALRTAALSTTTGYGGWNQHGCGSHKSWKAYLRFSIEDSSDFRGGACRQKLEQSPIGAGAFNRDAEVLLRRVVDMPETRHLIHGDMLNFNVFTQGERISGVIDWGCALYGDFLYDLAWFAFWWPWYPQWRDVTLLEQGSEHFARQGADLSLFSERMLVYQLQIGLTHQAYHANTDDWAMLEAVTRRTSAVADEIR